MGPFGTKFEAFLPIPQTDTVKFTRRLYPILLVFLTIWSCSKSPEGPELDPDTQTLVDILLDEMDPLDSDPLKWEVQDLRWLVENHRYKVFAFEADFGESIYINEAVKQGNAAEIESLMNTKMHFWTWKTHEVKELLEWMCNYKQGKGDEDKIQYVGVDCQFNTYHQILGRYDSFHFGERLPAA